jgi:glycosidase
MRKTQNKKSNIVGIALCFATMLLFLYAVPAKAQLKKTNREMKEKIVIYQVFTRLFGANSKAPVQWGDAKTNGCGKMGDFTLKALEEIKALGATHIWYTGVIAHATQTDYSAYGIPKDHPAVVKGKAGSPYAIKDYYDIDPDLATNVDKRMNEFENLVKRTHKAGLKMIIDFVPNHVARQYHSICKPEGVRDLGEDDNQDMNFSPTNNFYYLSGQPFTPSFSLNDADGNAYTENPAKATGNDQFTCSPDSNDWYETVKLNYGVDYVGGRVKHFDPVPDTWKKMAEILQFWASKGVDGFRCDMAEMVPCEFWHWAIPQVKAPHPDIKFIAEVYNPNEYRNYLHNGGFDYLYDKVGLYDTLRIVSNGASASSITYCWQSVDDIHDHMLNFLENHDEQRIASPYFCNNAKFGRPALIVSSLMHENPVMIYFGQELGEAGQDNEGFSGEDGRTTIFDYWTVQSIRRWRNNGKFDGTLLTEDEKALRAYYQTVLTLCNKEAAIREGLFYDIMYANYENPDMDTNRQYAFLRKAGKSLVLVVANFDHNDVHTKIRIPADAFTILGIPTDKGMMKVKDLLTGKTEEQILAPDGLIETDIEGSSGKVLKFKL